MASRPRLADVLIVGAGAAGIAAGQKLRRAGISALILEARPRIGGRAWTLQEGASPPLDLGCGWLHSADQNSMVEVAAELGMTLDRSTPSWDKLAETRNFSQADQSALQAALQDFYERLDAAAAGGLDRSGADLLEPGCLWNPLINAVSGYINGAELSEVSIIDFARYHDSRINWRVAEGYGALFQRWAQDLSIVLNCPVRAVDHSGAQVRVDTDRGAFVANAVIVSAPTDVLARGAITFKPGVADKLQAAYDLPLGANEKLFLALENCQEFEADTRVFGKTDSAKTGAYTLRPLGSPMVEAFFGGELARDLASAGFDALASFAVDEIASALGASMRKRLTPLAASSWSCEPWSLGAYSHARIGRADARMALANPVNDRLVFAGEACSPHFFTTAHGAAQSGRSAADFLLASGKLERQKTS